MLELICKKIGVDIGEKWIQKDDYTSNAACRYKIENNQLLYYCEDHKKWKEAWDDEYKMLVKGELTPRWKPMIGETYFIPDISDVRLDFQYKTSVWEGHTTDLCRYENRTVFQTKEEAIECTNKMLSVIR